MATRFGCRKTMTMAHTCVECGNKAERKVAFAGSMNTHEMCEECVELHAQSGALDVNLPLEA